MAREISTVGVVGLGTMGAGIVEVFAREGLTVVGLEISDDALDRGRGHLEGSTAKALDRGRISAEDRAALLGRVTFTTSYDDLAGCDLVVEAVPELMKLKRIVFGELDRVCKPGAILATNTSSLSVTEIAMTTERPEDVVGVHFFNPAPVMRLVEVVHTVRTAPDALAAVEELTARLGKTAVVVTDRAGFVANYLLFGYLNRAVRLHESGCVGRDELDAAMQLGAGFPMGPLTLLDMIGNDTAVEILETMHAQTGDPAHVPAALLRKLVTVGSLGRKSGRGFYDYGKPGAGRPVDARDLTPPTDLAVPAKVGVAGEGPLADELVALLTKNDVAIVRGGSDAAGFAGCDVVIEVLDTDADNRRAFLTAIADRCPGATVLVAGLGGDLTELSASTGLAGSLLGFHVLEATKRGRAVEIVRAVPSALADGDPAADASVSVARGLAAALGLTAVEVGVRPAYVVAGLLVPYLNDAIRMVEQGYASIDDVDHAMTLGCGYPLGPVAMADLLGLHRVLDLQERIHADDPQAFLAPSSLLRDAVALGRLGRESGLGFRAHDTGGAPE
jgi:3-hydroxybutyryl-CoA dehydrogenase